MSMTPEQLQAYTWQREIDERNRPLSNEELDSLFPEGYKVLQPPAGMSQFNRVNQKCIYAWAFLIVRREMEGLSEEGQYWIACVCWLRSNLPR